MKFKLLMLIALLCIAAPTSRAKADPDLGLPDSVFFKTPTVELVSCYREVRVTVPVYLFSDDFVPLYCLGLYVSGASMCEDARAYSLTSCHNCNTNPPTLRDSTYCHLCLVCSCYMTPGRGTIFDFVFRAHLGDTLTLTPDSNDFIIGDYYRYWFPTHMSLDTSFVLPDTIAGKTGDADCSGSIDISDAVFLITYIFAGGIPPFDMNAADENSDCAVDISDVVYLIAYIFSGGAAPQPAGC